jgi:hypothetical protein
MISPTGYKAIERTGIKDGTSGQTMNNYLLQLFSADGDITLNLYM